MKLTRIVSRLLLYNFGQNFRFTDADYTRGIMLRLFYSVETKNTSGYFSIKCAKSSYSENLQYDDRNGK